MKNLVYIFALFIFISPFLQCSKEEPSKPIENNVVNQNTTCKVGELPSTSLEQYFGCRDTRYSIKINLDDSFKLIRSQAEFKQYATSNCDFNIDFSNYDLIIGKKQLKSGNQSISYEYNTEDCITKKLKVIFKQDNSMFAPNITYHRLIPKISNTEMLQVEIVVH